MNLSDSAQDLARQLTEDVRVFRRNKRWLVVAMVGAFGLGSTVALWRVEYGAMKRDVSDLKARVLWLENELGVRR